MTLQEALNEFLFQKKLAGLSPKSIEDYQTILGILLTAVGSSMPLESLSYTTVTNYILSLYDRPLSRSTVATYIRNIRILFTGFIVSMDFLLIRQRLKFQNHRKKWYIFTQIQKFNSCFPTSKHLFRG